MGTSYGKLARAGRKFSVYQDKSSDTELGTSPSDGMATLQEHLDRSYVLMLAVDENRPSITEGTGKSSKPNDDESRYEEGIAKNDDAKATASVASRKVKANSLANKKSTKPVLRPKSTNNPPGQNVLPIANLAAASSFQTVIFTGPPSLAQHRTKRTKLGKATAREPTTPPMAKPAAAPRRPKKKWQEVELEDEETPSRTLDNSHGEMSGNVGTGPVYVDIALEIPGPKKAAGAAKKRKGAVKEPKMVPKGDVIVLSIADPSADQTSTNLLALSGPPALNMVADRQNTRRANDTIEVTRLGDSMINMFPWKKYRRTRADASKKCSRAEENIDPNETDVDDMEPFAEPANPYVRPAPSMKLRPRKIHLDEDVDELSLPKGRYYVNYKTGSAIALTEKLDSVGLSDEDSCIMSDGPLAQSTPKKSPTRGDLSNSSSFRTSARGPTNTHCNRR
jgi:hypothetical protein